MIMLYAICLLSIVTASISFFISMWLLVKTNNIEEREKDIHEILRKIYK